MLISVFGRFTTQFKVKIKISDIFSARRLLGIRSESFQRMQNSESGYKLTGIPMTTVYCFSQFVLDPAKRTLLRADSPVSLTPKAFDVLLFLARNPNRMVTKEELLQAVWGDTFVEEGNLAQYVWHLRKALGDNSENPRLIVTIARRGYQFTMDVTVADAGAIATVDKVQASAERSLAITRSGIEGREDKSFSKAPKPWPKAAFLITSTLILLAVTLAFWRHFAAVMPPSSQKIMLAVLPFQNLTGDPNKEYLADGLTEETISQLSRLNPERLGVISRTSVMGYKHKDERPDQIGRDLSVQYLLENSLRESGNHMRLTTQLIQVKDQTHLWSQEYNYPVKDILHIEEDVAKVVAREIGLRLTSQQQAKLAQPHTTNAEAFDANMQGFYFFERNTDADTNRAAESYERAVQLDPSYALAWVGLSRTRHWQAARGLIPRDEGRRLAREAVERALELNPNLAIAHIQMGRIKRQDDFDWAGAEASTQRAILLEPGNPETLELAAFSALILGRFDEALSLNRRAVELDPLNAESWESLGETQFFKGQLDDAAVSHKKALEMKPDLWYCHSFLSQAYILQGRPKDALPEIDAVQNLKDWGLFLHALAYYRLGRKQESDAALTELIAKFQAVDEYLIAGVYAFRNQPHEAFEWLNRGYAKHNDGLIQMKIDPLLKNLHSDPRYAALLKKLNLPN
jgi:TolB-like protein/DNA-binding winged helix-turn-helix (wHTH) protein